jgi:hypothetical protein
LLQFETVESGRSHIQEIQKNAAASVEGATCEEVLCRGEGLALVSGGAKQGGKSPPCGRVIIRYDHSWSLAAHYASLNRELRQRQELKSKTNLLSEQLIGVSL